MILRRNAARVALAAFAIALLASSGCVCARRAPRSSGRVPLPLQILADRGSPTTLALGEPDTARAWISRVSTKPPEPARVSPASPGALALPLPAVRFDSLPEPPEAATALAVDEDLKPPIPRGATPLRLPPRRGRALRVDLDVRIDEQGDVSDALWAGGSSDSAAVAAATTCALSMRFFPALQRGRAVAVWCRQRFEFGSGVARPLVNDDEPDSTSAP